MNLDELTRLVAGGETEFVEFKRSTGQRTAAAWGRGTIKMVELTQEAGLPPPEYESSGGEFIVRFCPSRYIPPTRVGHDLSPLQRELLNVVAQLGPAPLMAIREGLSTTVPERTVQDNLQLLRQLGLVELTGAQRSARWRLRHTGRG